LYYSLEEHVVLNIVIGRDELQFSERFSITFQRTLRIPDDDHIYPLPPGLGAFPIFKVDDYADRVPEMWSKQGGVFIPMYQREALWLGFNGAFWKPNAVQIAVGTINAVSGEVDTEGLHTDPQDYLVCPDQPWLDGINTGPDEIRQFVAMPLGLGYTIEAAVRGEERFGGIQITVYEPQPGRFPDVAPPENGQGLNALDTIRPMAMAQPMGLGAGGAMRQKIYPDPYGIATWDQSHRARIVVHIANSAQFRDLTGGDPPPTPIDAKAYTEAGLPWFDLYDERKSDVAPSERLANVPTVAEQDADRGTSADDQTSVDIPETQIRKLTHGKERGT
jgi:hypothetical protein